MLVLIMDHLISMAHPIILSLVRLKQRCSSQDWKKRPRQL